jgi:NADH-quinone oxidoreductase subunit J
LSFLSVRSDRDLRTGDQAAAAKAAGTVKPLSAGYLLPFEIVSVHLLVVLVGAAYLARTKRRAAA